MKFSNDVNDLTFRWTSSNISNLIKSLIINNLTFKPSVYTPVLNNINVNKGKNDHDNCVNAVIANSIN